MPVHAAEKSKNIASGVEGKVRRTKAPDSSFDCGVHGSSLRDIDGEHFDALAFLAATAAQRFQNGIVNPQIEQRQARAIR